MVIVSLDFNDLSVGSGGKNTTGNYESSCYSTSTWNLGEDGIVPNDGSNESTGHYYVCP